MEELSILKYCDNKEILNTLISNNISTLDDILSNDLKFFYNSYSKQQKEFRNLFIKILQSILNNNKIDLEFKNTLNLLFQIHPEIFLSYKAIRVLKRAKINNFRDIYKLNLNEIKLMRGIGKKTFNELFKLYDIVRLLFYSEEELKEVKNSKETTIEPIEHECIGNLYSFLPETLLNEIKSLNIKNIFELFLPYNLKLIYKLSPNNQHLMIFLYKMINYLKKINNDIKSINISEIENFFYPKFRKIFFHLRLKKISDIIKLSNDDLLNIPSVGLKTFEIMKDVISILKFLLFIFEHRKQYDTELSTVNNQVTFEDIIENLKSVMIILDDTEKEILDNKLGKNVSLQSIGDKLGLTKERVRQIEKSMVENKLQLLMYLIENYLNQINSNFFKLECYSDYLFETKIIESLILYNKKFKIEKISENIFIKNISKKDLKKLQKKGKDILFKNGLPIKIYKLEENFQKENLPLLILDYLLDNYQAVIDQKNVIFYKKLRKQSIVELIMNKEKNPLHFTEIAQKYRELSGENIEDRSIHAILSRFNNVLLIDRGTFQNKAEFIKEMGIENINEILNESHFILKNINSYIDTINLLNLLSQKINISNKINPYSLKSILKLDKEKRFVFGHMLYVSSIYSEIIDINKINFSDAIFDILNNSDKPLSIESIINGLNCKNIVISYQNLLKYITNELRIIKINKNLYSTIDKLNINIEDINTIFNNCHKIIKENDFPISTYYLSDYLKMNIPKFQLVNLNHIIISSILKKNSNFEVFSDNIVFLSKLADVTNIKSIKDIFLYILKIANHKLSIEEIREQYKILTKDFKSKKYNINIILDKIENIVCEDNKYFIKN